MAEKPTVWPMYVVGVICFGVSALLIGMFVFVVLHGSGSSRAEVAAAALPFMAGVAAFRAAADHRAAVRARAAVHGSAKLSKFEDSEAARPAPLPVVRSPEPPRIGDDPFRDPPGRPPIVVVHHRGQPAAPPIVPGDPGDAPKLLT